MALRLLGSQAELGMVADCEDQRHLAHEQHGLGKDGKCEYKKKEKTPMPDHMIDPGYHEPLLSTNEAAALLRVPVNTVRRMVKRGSIRCVKRDRKVFFRLQDLGAFLTAA
jgi:excisionase family DNA binding protein